MLPRTRKSPFRVKTLIESPWDTASFLSKFTLALLIPLFKKGWKGSLDSYDVREPPTKDESRSLGIRLEREYSQQFKYTGGSPSFAKAIIRAFGNEMILVSTLELISVCFLQPFRTVTLGWILRDVSSYLTFSNSNQTNRNLTIFKLKEHEYNFKNQNLNHHHSYSNLNSSFMTPSEEVIISREGEGEGEEELFWKVIYDVITLVIVNLLTSTLSQPFLLTVTRTGMKMRVASSFMIYKKSLRLSQTALAETTAGQVVNLLSNDVNRFDLAAAYAPYLIIAPLQTLIAFTILAVLYIGLYPTLACILAIIFYMLTQLAIGKGFSLLRNKTAIQTDQRIQLINELLQSIRVIKMYAWEKPFRKLIEQARKREIKMIAFTSILKTINQTLFFNSTHIWASVGLITYVILDLPLSPEIVFVTIGLANLLRTTMTYFFPAAISFVAEASISCKRINDFLMLSEFRATANLLGTYRTLDDSFGHRYTVVMNKVWCSWASAEENIQRHLPQLIEKKPDNNYDWAIIRDLSLALNPQELLLIVGQVGSGKSSILMALLGELPLLCGQIEINGRISYASQEPWIYSGSVRENILLGNILRPERYAEVLRVCSLERDLETLVDGDETIVGERGVSLSGGQRARVNLARALYAEADIYLLDDPLSAVDGPVACHIFEEVFRTFLRKKTIILATHQLHFLRYATKVLVMDREQVASFGALHDVLESPALKKVGFGKETFDSTSYNDERTTKEASKLPAKPQKTSTTSLDDLLTRSSRSLSGSILLQGADSTTTFNNLPQQISLSQKSDAFASRSVRGTEELKEVSTDIHTVLYYYRKALDVLILIWFLVINILAQVFFLGSDFFLSFWTESAVRKDSKDAPESILDDQAQSFFDHLTNRSIISIYAVIVIACLAASFARAATFFMRSVKASKEIHQLLLNSVIQAPMTFFDFTPIGVLMNRFSRDIGFVDELLPSSALEIVAITVYILAIFIILIVIDYTNLIILFLLVLLSVFVYSIARPTIIRLKQVEGITRSPIFSHMSTTLTGLSTIRASRVQNDFLRDFDRHQDTHSGSWFAYLCASRWLTIYLEWAVTIFTSVAVSFLLGFSLDSLNTSLTGLVISHMLILPSTFSLGARQLIELESQMTSVQRIREFSELEPEETENEKSLYSNRMIDFFKIQKGEISFKNVTLKYFPDEPPVLKNISFTVKAGEKIGVVGRTGAGKSSIISVLFRLYNFEGSVELDGFDINEVSLDALRKEISIIPQDPVLFEGSVRKNLDPFEEYSDESIWLALEAVQMRSLIMRDQAKLDFNIQEGGSNFSIGQRQLICLARAILRRNQILVLDEATANVDPETDMLIQRAISEQFANCTVITIAHRLITIVKSNRVLVLDRGEVKEFAAPYELIQKSTSLFSQMVAGSGGQAESIKKNIKLEHEKRLSQAPTNK